MKIVETNLPGVLHVLPDIFRDSRGHFFEVFRAAGYADLGIPAQFVQDNFSRSKKGTLRGLHFQQPHGQAKLVGAMRGAVYDVAVDFRVGSPTFGQWYGAELNDTTHGQLFIPTGFGHGFCVLSEEADVFYKCTEVYRSDCDRVVAHNDPQIGIRWPVENPLLSPKDGAAPNLADSHAWLPRY